MGHLMWAMRIVFFLALAVSTDASVRIPTRRISPTVEMPVISIGTWTQSSQNSTLIVNEWLALGGRGVDTAAIYGDQALVGAAINAAGLHNDVFITTKIPGCFEVAKFVEKDLKLLNVSSIDLLLLHSDLPDFNCANSWKVLEQYQQQGKVKSIGISNFKSKAILKLLETATIPPAVNQIEVNVFSHDDDTIQTCAIHNITVEAYSPFGSPGRDKKARSIFSDPTIGSIAKAHNVSAAQVSMRWLVQRGRVVTFLSENPAHQANDADIFGFSLSESEMGQIYHLKNSTSIE